MKELMETLKKLEHESFMLDMANDIDVLDVKRLLDTAIETIRKLVHITYHLTNLH